MKNCLTCSKETKNPKFCSSSCSATFNNKTIHRKHEQHKCKNCDTLINYHESRCLDCRKIHRVTLDTKKKAKILKPKKNISMREERVDKTKCITCNKQLDNTTGYKHHKGFYPTCKVCHNRATQHRQQGFKRDCVDYKGGKCERCGYCNNYGSLDFHHLDPTQKDFTISRCQSQKFDDRIKIELDKCILLCRNCHGEEHYPHLKKI